MGQPKALLPFGESTMIETVLANLSRGGVDGIVVVVSPAIAEAVGRAAGGAAGVVINPLPDSEMIESIQMALAHLAEAAAPDPYDGCVVLPADQPQVGAASVRRCVEAFRTAPERIIIATRGTRRGHPILFPWALADAVCALPPTTGLNHLPRQHVDRVLEVACDDDGVVTDIDTPEDYERARRK